VAQLRSFLLLCGSAMLWASVGSPVRASVAYVLNCCNHPSTVSVVDTASSRQTGQWSVGTDAFAAVFSPDGSTAYISSEVSESVSVVQVSTGNVLATIPTGYQVTWMAITPDGSKLFAQSYDYAYESHIIAINTATNTVINTADTERCWARW